MKSAIIPILSIILLLAFAACSKAADNRISQNEPSEPIAKQQIESTPNSQSAADIEPSDEPKRGESSMMNISVTVGSSVFSAKLYDNEAAKALLAQLPLTLNMAELNGNEKYYNLAGNLPANSQPAGTINAGDLMLYGADCLVLFYESFSSSYSYTKLGYIEDVSELASALGNGSVEVALAVSD